MGSTYAQAAWIAALLSLGLWPFILYNTIGPSLMGLGKPQYNALGSVGRILTLVGGGIVGYSLGGFLGLLIALALADLPNYVAIQVGLYRERLTCYRQDLIATALFVAVYAGFLLARHALGIDTPWGTYVVE